MIEIVLEMLTVTLNVPKLVPTVRTHFNNSFRGHFPHDHNTTVLLWARPVCQDTGSCSSPDHPALGQIIRYVLERNRQIVRIIQPRVRSSDSVQ